MKPPRKGLKVGDLVDGNPITEIYSDGDIKIRYLSGIIALADAIKDMGTLSIANVMGNMIGKDQLSKLQEIMHSKPNLVSLCGIADDATGAVLSGLGIDADDAAILVSELPDKGALTSLHVGKNNIPEKEMKEIMAIAMRMSSMKTLCEVAFKDKTLTELDVSGKNLGMEGALVVAEYLGSNGALLSLDISSNGLFAEGTKLLAKALESNQTMTSLNISSNYMTYDGNKLGDMSGVAALADVILGMGALSTLIFGYPP
jgi:Ran GTPase-activating protein (RanGAP) involved in mRNA processing and transport